MTDIQSYKTLDFVEEVHSGEFFISYLNHYHFTFHPHQYFNTSCVTYGRFSLLEFEHGKGSKLGYTRIGNLHDHKRGSGEASPPS